MKKPRGDRPGRRTHHVLSNEDIRSSDVKFVKQINFTVDYEGNLLRDQQLDYHIRTERIKVYWLRQSERASTKSYTV